MCLRSPRVLRWCCVRPKHPSVAHGPSTSTHSSGACCAGGERRYPWKRIRAPCNPRLRPHGRLGGCNEEKMKNEFHFAHVRHWPPFMASTAASHPSIISQMRERARAPPRHSKMRRAFHHRRQLCPGILSCSAVATSFPRASRQRAAGEGDRHQLHAQLDFEIFHVEVVSRLLIPGELL